MPQKPKLKKEKTSFVLDGKSVDIILHPPTDKRRSWYAYWNGLETSKSTGQAKLEQAKVSVEQMVRAWQAGGSGKRVLLGDMTMTDEEMDQIQRAHFSKKTDPTAKKRASKTYNVYQQAAIAFKNLTGLSAISRATPGDCERFQAEALQQPKNWRQQHPKSKKDVAAVSPNTVLKWSRALQAAFQRANRNAGKRCVRGVVSDDRLLQENPWNNFTWIDGVEKEVRQFTPEELVSILDCLEGQWPDVEVGRTMAKVFLWSRCRLEAVTGLRWESARCVGTEHHFHVVEKRGVQWWFRLPDQVFDELARQRTESPFVFAAYNEQLRKHHANSPRPERVAMVSGEFEPRCLGDWFYDRLADWSADSPGGHAHPHVFRKTSLQLAWDGDEARRQALADAKVSEKVLRTSYIKQSDKERREESNRNYYRIASALPPAVAGRYGYLETTLAQLEGKLAAATAAKDWVVVAQLSAEVMNLRPASAG
jgi:integrase